MSRKDTYRQKVYDAENRWIKNYGSHGTLPIDEANEVLYDLTQHFTVPLVGLRLNRSLKQWSGWYKGGFVAVIEVAREEPALKTVLHEFAHHLDASRRGDYDGKGHGGSYTQAMLEVVEFHFKDTALMVALMRCYEAEGALVGATESRKVAERSSTALARREERHGLVEEAWVVKVTHPKYGTQWLTQDKLGLARSVTSAGVWKRQVTAEKAMDIARSSEWSSEVIKVEAKLDTLFTNRWWALREVE